MADAQMSDWAQLALGIVGGSVGTLVAMRTRLAMMTRDISDSNAKREALGVVLDEHIQKSDRRQMVILRLLADVARKVGVDQRTFDDALVRMLSDEPNRRDE